ncbi:MAG: molybdopterin cofactor-binding domain-containing protein [Pontixanthobacter sp.]
MEVTRRGVLVGAAVGGGLLVAWGLRPRVFPAPLTPSDGEYAFAAWLKIARDGVVTVAVPQLEMGQGVTTILPQIICTELGADWRQIGVEAAPVSGAYANLPLAAKWAPLWMPFLPGLADAPDDLATTRFAQTTRFSATADGTTLAAYETPARMAAATARHLLIEAAADIWDIDTAMCEAVNGFIVAGKRRLPFGDLVAAAAQREPPEAPAMRARPAAERPSPQRSAADDGASPIDYPRLDLPSKVDGTYPFAADIRLPDMLYAAIKHGPVDDSMLIGFDADIIADHPRVTNIVRGKRWVAAVATDWWSANQAVEAIRPRFSVAAIADSGGDTKQLLDALRSDEGEVVICRGEGGDIAPDFARRYCVAAAHHAMLETASVTARLADGRLELWMASQSPEHARAAAAAAIGFDTDDVVLYLMAAGGSFDRRLEHPHAIEAALIAREVSQDRPRAVQLVWSRWQEHLAGLPRSPAAGLLWATMREDGNGAIGALHTRIAAPPAGHEFGARLFGNETPHAARQGAEGKADPMVVTGAMQPYAIPRVTVEHMPVAIGHGVGRMRGNAHGHTAFFTECFIDEIAAQFGREPLSYRIEMLGGDPRLVECLQRAGRLAGWDGGRGSSGQGLACHVMRDEAREAGTHGEGRIACIATARREGGGARVSRLAAAVDIGRIVNRDIARQQIEGGLIYGLSLALGSAAIYANGLPTAQRLADLDLPRLADCPDMTVEFVESDAPPFDPGELGVAVAAPAIANALHSATGMRLRTLPLFS